MDKQYSWHFNDDEYMRFAKNMVAYSIKQFNYRDFITPHDESRELIGRIIEEFQYLEALINNLLEHAIQNGIYSGKVNFNLDKFSSATKIIKALSDVLIEEQIAKELLSLIKFRNYIIHAHYLTEDSDKRAKEFPQFLYKVLSANDYVSNVINRIIGGATHTPNIFEVKA